MGTEIKTADLIQQEENEDNTTIETDDGMEIRTDVIDVKIESKRKYDTEIKIDGVIEKEEKEDDMERRTDDAIEEEVKKDVIDEKVEKKKDDVTDIKADDVIEKEEKEDIVYGTEREDHVFQMNSETVTKVESEESNCKEVIEKGEELKKEDSVEYVQQSEDEHISVIDDYKKVEVEKNDDMEKKSDDVF